MEPAMSLVLHAHPLSSYCHKVLTALYELDAPFELAFLNLGDEPERAAFHALWPIGKMPVLEDRAAGLALPESSIIIEWLNDRFGGRLIPTDKAAALDVRLWDRIFDTHAHAHMQTFASHLMRPEGQRDPLALQIATDKLNLAYDLIDKRMAGREWAAGEHFSMADCAAGPALFYAEQRVPFGGRRNLAAYLDRLKARPSYARALKEAEPYVDMVPR
jgi:glutathione S-transferase